jgi:hypothetical protein
LTVWPASTATVSTVQVGEEARPVVELVRLPD